MTRKVGKTSTVTFHLKGIDENGEVVDSTFDEGKPLTAVMGTGCILRGVEKALLGMARGESTSVRILSEDGYGPRDEALVRFCDRTILPRGYNPEVGDILSLVLDEREQRPVTIVGVERTRVRVDLNHPLCGRIITYDITIVGVE